MKKAIFFVLINTSIYATGAQTQKNIQQDILASNIDSTVKPGDDFFMYANGGWIKATPIPGSESGWGIGNLVMEDNYTRLKKINEDAVKANAAEGTISQKIGDFWRSAMDTVAINKAGLAPLKSDIDKINAVKNVNDLLRVGARLQQKGINCFFNNYISQDDMNSNAMAFKLDQGGLGMPNRDYYFNTDATTTAVREAYKIYLLKTFRQLGYDGAAAQKNATAVLKLETKLAGASRNLADLRDPYKNYNKMDMAALSKLSPGINWNDFVKNSRRCKSGYRYCWPAGILFIPK